MPLNLTDINSRGDIATLNKWASWVETQLHGTSNGTQFAFNQASDALDKASTAITTVDLTKVNFRGAWNSSAVYKINDMVSYQGNNYLCIRENVNQTPTPAGTIYWENTGPTTQDSLPDGSSNFTARASTLSYRPTSNPLSSTDLGGGSASLSVAGFTLQTSSKGSISVSSGTVAGASVNTLYYIYYDDSTLVGGSVIFNATTVKTTALNGAGRIYVGSIQTPPNGGSPTIGNNDGGTGAQFGAYQKVFFSSSSVSTLSGFVTNPGNANDGSDATSAAMGSTSGSGTFAKLTLSLPPISTNLFLSASLNIKTDGSSTGTGQGLIEYSTDNGTSWTTIRNQTGSSTWGPIVDTVSLTGPMNLGRTQVRATVINNGSPGAGSASMDFFEAWIEVVY